MVSITFLQLASILFVLAFFCFPFILFLFPFFSCWLGILHLKEPGTFFFQFFRWGGSCYFRPSLRGGFANFTPIGGMGHLICEPKFKIPTPPPPLLISDKSLSTPTTTSQQHLKSLLPSKKIVFVTSY